MNLRLTAVHSTKDPANFSFDEDDANLQVFVNMKGILGKLTSKCEDFAWR